MERFSSDYQSRTLSRPNIAAFRRWGCTICLNACRDACHEKGARGAGGGPTAATTTTTAPRTPRRKATGMKGGKGAKSEGEVKNKKVVGRVQKSTKTKKGGTKAVRKTKQKAKGKKVADEDEKEEPEPEPEPVSTGKGKGMGEAKGSKGVDKVRKSTSRKERGIQAVRKAKQKAKGTKVADGAELEDQKPVDEGAGKGKEVAAVNADEAEKKQVQAAGQGKGKEKAIAADEGKGEQTLQRFTRADLQEAGALESDSVKMPTLTNAIHPIWAPEKFRFAGGTDATARAEAYAAVAPALRLASLWIERARYGDFWATMWNGRLMRISRPRGGEAEGLAEDDPGEGLTSEGFRDLASLEGFRCEWRFGPQALGTWAKTEEGIGGVSGCVTTLHDDFEWLARSPQPGSTVSERLRGSFFLAVNLVRELVQQVCRFKHRDQYGENVGPLARSSVFYQPPEGVGFPLDVAWENFMFEGPIHQINSPMGPMAPDGLAVRHSRSQTDPTRVYMPVRVDWISEQFSVGFWSADDVDEDDILPGLPNGSNVYAKELVID